MFASMETDFGQRTLAWISRTTVIALAALVLVNVPLAPARAQQPNPTFAVFPIPTGLNEGEDRHKEIKRIKDRVIAGTLGFNESKQALDEWYNGYFFRSFTQPDQLDKLPLKRQELLADLKRTGKDTSKPVHDYLLQRSVTFMKGFLASERRTFHPAVRFNAALILGDLNQDEISIQQRVPNPVPTMLDELVNAYRDEKQIDAVRVAVLLGMIRHAKLDWNRLPAQRIDAGKRNAIGQLMLDLLNETDPPQDRSMDGHVWMQRRAVDLLAALGLVGQVDTVTSTIDAIVASESRPISLRCTAAEALAMVLPNSPAKPDASTTSLNLASLAATAGKNTLDWIDAYKLAQQAKKAVAGGAFAGGGAGYGMMGPGGMMGGMGMMGGEGMEGMGDMGGEDYSDMMGDMMGGMPGMMGGMPGGLTGTVEVDPEVQLAQRRLLSKLVCVQSGLTSVAVVAAPASKSEVDNVVQRVEALVQATLTPPEDEPNLDGLARSIRKAVRDIESVTKKSAALGIPADSGALPSETPGDVPADVPADVPGDLPADVPGG